MLWLKQTSNIYLVTIVAWNFNFISEIVILIKSRILFTDFSEAHGLFGYDRLALKALRKSLMLWLIYTYAKYPLENKTNKVVHF